MHRTLSLAFEWEVVLLNAFSKVGRVRHEASFGSRRTPDLYFESNADSKQCFAADITTISDKGFEDSNPYQVLQDELNNRVEKHGLRPDSFSLSVEGNHHEVHKGRYNAPQN